MRAGRISHTQNFTRLSLTLFNQIRYHYLSCNFGMSTQAGLDSLGAVEFRNAVSAAFPVQLSATAAFDYPTAAALAAHISAELALTQRPSDLATTPGFVLTTRDSLGPVLESLEKGWTTEVVGMACVYPGSGTGAICLCR